MIALVSGTIFPLALLNERPLRDITLTMITNAAYRQWNAMRSANGWPVIWRSATRNLLSAISTDFVIRRILRRIRPEQRNLSPRPTGR
jgi:hypothetical protein